ncbi:hypothetical protein CHUAL_009779 [Chamberlinius hualienensis]
MKTIAILVLSGLVVLISAVQAQQEEIPVGQDEYDLGPVEEEFVEEPTTTARPARRRLPGSRARPRNQDAAATAAVAPAAAPAPRSTTTTTTTDAPTERPRSRSRANSNGNGSGSSARTTTAKSVDVTEQPASTYRRPKFPPRRLPVPTKRTTTEAPIEEIFTDDPLYADGPAAEGPLGPDGQPETPIEEEIPADQVR